MIKNLPSLLHLLWVFPLLLFAPTLVSGQALIWGTPSLQFIPWRVFTWEQIQNGIWPFWNPLNGMGAPLIANYQLAFYYPPGWLLYALQAIGGSAWLAWGHALVLAGHLAWAGFGTARLVRQWGLDELAQVTAGLAFSLSSYLVARAGFFSMVWSAAWLPWLVICVDWITEANSPAKRWRATGWLGLCAGLQLLSGHAQLTWYSLIFAGCWSLVAGFKKGRWKHLAVNAGYSAIGVLIGVAVASVQLIPTLELLQQSQRATAVNYEVAMTYSFWPWRLLTFLAPSFFGNPAFGDYWGYASYWEDAVYLGLLPFLMALTTIGMVWRQRAAENPRQDFISRIRFLWIFVLAGFLLGLGNNTPVFPFLYRNIPTFDMFQAPARFMLWAVFSLSLLAAVAIEYWKLPAGKALRRLRRLPFVLVAVCMGAIAAFFIIPGIKTSFVYSTLSICILTILSIWLIVQQRRASGTHARIKWSWGVAILMGLDLVIAGWGQNPATQAQFYAVDEPPNSPESATLGRLYMDETTEYRLKFDRFLRFEDYRPLENWTGMRDAQLPNLNLLDKVASANNFDPLRPARYDRWMEYISSLSPDARIPWLRMMGVTRVESIDSHEDLAFGFSPMDGAQRIRFTPCAVSAQDEADAWEKTRSMIENGFNHTVIEVAQGQNLDCNLKYNDKISILSEHADRLVLSVDVDVPGWLSVADTWYPGWKASIDGSDTAIVRANYAFRAIFLPAGEHSVVFEYKPDWWLPAVLASMAGLLVLITLLLI